MSERLAAELWIGGNLAPHLVDELCAAIAQQEVSLEWGDAFFRPESAEALLAAVRPNRDSVRILWLCDDQARWGEFDSLEPFLQRHEIPFTRLTAGRNEYDSERVEFRPDHGRVGYVANAAGAPVIAAAKVAEAESALTDVITSARPRSIKRLLAAVQSARGKLRQALPPIVAPLPAFGIAGL